MPKLQQFRWLAAVLAAAMLIAGVSTTVLRASAATGTQTYTYQGSSQNFPNPERGFASERIIYYSSNWNGQGGLTLSDLQSIAQKGNDVVWVYYVLQNFAGTITPFQTSCPQPYVQNDDEPLPQDFLTGMNNDLGKIRQAGLKIVLRFTYNFGYAADAPLCRILGHIDQIGPVLQQNADIIDFIEAGFVGAWGEWHDSTNGLFTNDAQGVGQVNAATTAIIDEELAQFPSQRMILLRYPRHTMELFGTTPLTAQNAYSGSNLARIGAHNDCFLLGPDEGGTYQEGNNGTITIQQQQQFLQQDNQYVPQFGETCGVSSPYTDCPNALTELAAYHWSSLNQDYDQSVLSGWGSCMSQIQEDLGYRFRLTRATIPTSIQAGQTLNMSFAVANDGWANLFNPRNVELILINQQNSTQRYTIPLNVDPRFWSSGQTTPVNVSVVVPGNVVPGAYNLYLNLPDPAPSLHSNPAYSIQLANTGVWDATTGYNSLQASLQVTSSSGSTPTPVPTGTLTPTATPTNTPTPTPTPGPGTSYEAEASNNTLAGGAVVASCSGCSGGEKVGYVGNNAGTLTFNGVSASSAGNYTLTIYYTNGQGSNRTASLSVNGGSPITLSFPPTSDWNTVGSISTTVSLNAGSNNTLEFFNPTSGSWAPDFDRIVISGGASGTPTPTPTPTSTPTPTPTPTSTSSPTPSPTPGSFSLSIEAESSSNTLVGGATIESCAACSGGEDVEYMGYGTNNAYMVFNNVTVPASGQYTLTFYYSSDSARTADITINGNFVQTVSFPSTGGWGIVSSLSITIALQQGSNTIKFSNPSVRAPNLDRIVVSS